MEEEGEEEEEEEVLFVNFNLCLLKRYEVTHLALVHFKSPLVHSATSFVVHCLLIILWFSAVYWRYRTQCFCTPHQIFG